MKTKRMSKREVKKLEDELNELFECQISFSGKALFRTTKGRIYLCNKEMLPFLKSRARIEGFGLYFAFVTHRNELRLSIEGSQILMSFAKKNIFEATFEQIEGWVRGMDLEYDDSMSNLEPNFVLIKHGKDCYGCGRFTGKKIVNYVSKWRRIRNLTKNI